jgi:thymidine kinase
VPIAGPEQIGTHVEGCDVVGLDEVHFHGTALVEVCRELVARGLRLIAAGVDIDHRGRPFPVFPPLQAMADELVHRTARCVRCGGEAEFSQRMINDDSPIVVGGADLYEPRCRFCFRRP